MLKLMRVENTNIFIIANESKNKKNEVDGIVRIEKKTDLDEVKIFEKKEESWLKEVEDLREIKRKELYKIPEKEKKKINMEMLILHYFNQSNRNYISARKVLRLLAHVFVTMSKKGLLRYYNLECNVDEGCIIANAIQSSFFRVDQIGEIIYLMDDKSMRKILLTNPLDEVVIEMINEFVKNNEYV